MNILLAILVLGSIAAVFGALLGFASVRFKVDADPIVEQLSVLLVAKILSRK
jgi:electron transport complex protein RnfB